METGHTGKRFGENLVSIIVPAYNYALYIREAIDSALIQTYDNIEVVVVDDGSLDDTADVVKQIIAQDHRVFYTFQSNQGLSAARNTGLQHAKGDYVVFLDADDKMHPEKIEAHLQHFSQHPATDISYGRSRYFLSSAPEKTYASLELDDKDWMPGASGAAAELLPILIVNNIMPVCSAMLRKSACDRIGKFDTSLKSLEDWDYWIRAAAGGCLFEFSEDNRLAAMIRVHEASMSKNALRMLKTEYLLRKKSIPAAIVKIKDQDLARKIIVENSKLKILRLIDIAEETGIANLEFLKLCYGDSLRSVKKAVTRYLKRKSANKASA